MFKSTESLMVAAGVVLVVLIVAVLSYVIAG